MDKQVMLIRELIKNALKEVYENDHYLIEYQPSDEADKGSDRYHHVGERAIVFRFAYYLQKEIEEKNKDESFNGVVLDCEFNRNTKDLKTLEGWPNGAIPDIIVHERGTNNNNLLVLEFKTYWNNDQTNDEEKIRLLTDPSGSYSYKYGATIMIDSYKAIVKRFQGKDDIDGVEDIILIKDHKGCYFE